MRSNGHSRLAFTLVELLVVIAVIAVLAGLLLPAMKKAKERAQLAKCMSNQRQFGFAYHMYADDHQDFGPRHSGYANYAGATGTHSDPLTGGTTPAKDRPMTRYLAATDLFHCPADRGTILNGRDVGSSWVETGNSYATFWHWGHGVVDGRNQVTGDSTVALDDPDGFGRPGKLSEFLKSPHNKVLQGDAPWRMSKYDEHRKRVWHPPRNKREDITMKGQQSVTGRRDDFMLFADCHVDFIFIPRGMSVWANPTYLSEWW
jgi:prepilin-type N-terminal cleavage/methylation domain-containing protein